MKAYKVMTAIMLVLLAVPFLGRTFAMGYTIHPFVHGGIPPHEYSRTSPPGDKIGCLTSSRSYTLYIDIYYMDVSDDDQRIDSLSFQSGDGSNEASYVPVGFTVTWEYSYDGSSWNSYSGTGDIDVPWSGKNAIGDLDGSEPHVIVRVTFPVTGSLGDKFYYRVHLTSYYHIENNPPGNAGNHYFWYEICNVEHPPNVPEFGLGIESITSVGLLVAYAIKRKRKS